MAEREASAAAKDSDLRLAHSSVQSVTAELQSQRQVLLFRHLYGTLTSVICLYTLMSSSYATVF